MVMYQFPFDETRHTGPPRPVSPVPQPPPSRKYMIIDLQ